MLTTMLLRCAMETFCASEQDKFIV